MRLFFSVSVLLVVFSAPILGEGSDNSTKLIGVWQATKFEDKEVQALLTKGVVIELVFAKDGMHKSTTDGETNPNEAATYKVKADKIIIRVVEKSKKEGKKDVEFERTLTIKKLTDKELHVKDDQAAEGKRYAEFKRIK